MLVSMAITDAKGRRALPREGLACSVIRNVLEWAMMTRGLVPGSLESVCSPDLFFPTACEVFTPHHRCQWGFKRQGSARIAGLGSSAKARLAPRSLGSETKCTHSETQHLKTGQCWRVVKPSLLWEETSAEATLCSPGEPCPVTAPSQPRGCWENPTQVQRPLPRPRLVLRSEPSTWGTAPRNNC